MEVTTWSGSVDTGGLSTGAYLKTGHEIKSDGDNPVTRAEYIAVDDDRLDDVLAAIQAAQSACEGQITSISGRVTTAESSISGLDTRVTALEESGGGGSGGTTNYNELTNIPTINGVTVKGNLSAQNLGLANAVDIPTPMVSYGTCTTAAATAAKVVTLVNADGWVLKIGCVIMVKNSYTNTAKNPTLNVNGSGAKNIIFGSVAITEANLSYAAESNRQTAFFYNGESWVWIAHSIDNNTTYTSKAAASGGTATSLVTTGEKYIWNNKYDKPSDGIPKTDLSSAVQTSLGKADTALQSYTEKYTGTYSKPSGGIPKTDLASAVQTSLGKADTALQSYTETDPTVPSWAKASSKPTYTASEVGLGNVGNFKAVSTVASQGLTNTEKSNARANIGAGTSSFSGSYNDLTNKPTIPTVPTNVSAFNNDAGYLTEEQYTGTYSKPSGGIPKSDLSSDVKSSLAKADTALQVHQSLADYIKVYTVTGTGTTAGTWKGTISGITSYTDGLTILYKINVAGASTTTLNINSIGAKTVYLYSSVKLTTHYPVNAVIMLRYNSALNSGCWEMVNGRDTNTTYSNREAASGGTSTSLCTNGEKYIWNNKADNAVVTTSSNGLMSADDKISLNLISSLFEIVD